MKIKNIIFVVLAFSVTFFSACDIVEEPYKTTNDGGGPPVDDVVQKVLLEDYTGHDCVNCPTAAKEAEDLQEIYGEQLIVIAVHAGYFARPIPEEPSLASDYRTDAGEAYYTFFQTYANPVGLVNRTQSSPGNYLVEVGEWGSTIATEIEKEPQAIMEIENVYTESSRKLETTVTTQFLTPQTDQFFLVVCITQDSIIDGQKNNDPNVGETPLIEHYVFQHMHRGNLNGDWGENLTNEEPVVVEIDYEKTYTVTFPDEWIPKDCHVVAYIYNEQSRTILQVEEAHVLE